MAETEVRISPWAICDEPQAAIPKDAKSFFDLVWEANKLGLDGKRLVQISMGADFDTGAQIYRLIHEDANGT